MLHSTLLRLTRYLIRSSNGGPPPEITDLSATTPPDTPSLAQIACERWAARLESQDEPLSAEERAALLGAIDRVVELPADHDVVRQGEIQTESNLLLDGWACRIGDLSDGRRQILALHISGDFVDLHSFQVRRMDHTVRTLTPCRIAMAPHERLTEITETMPRLGRRLWLSTLIDAAVLRQWMVGLGQRSARENAAHLMCELFYRLRAVGMTDGPRFRLPLNQIEIGEALGVSAVHTNRVLQELKAERAFSLRGQAAEVLDLDRLEAIADFDPTYLHLPGWGKPA